MRPSRCELVRIATAFLVWAAAAAARGASYLPLPDEELARRAPVIIRAVVFEQEATAGVSGVATATQFVPLEVFKGRIAGETFVIELPGGVAEDAAEWVPGTPSFSPGDEVILFLAPSEDPERFGLTEFGLSKFEIVADVAGRRFATRSVLGDEDEELSGRGARLLRRDSARLLRDAESFAGFLRSLGKGEEPLPVSYAEAQLRPGGATPSWVNIGGTEGSNRLYRWFWDTGRSPVARVTPVGTQSGLSDGSDGLASVENAVLQWSGVPGAVVRYSTASGSAQVVVNLDVASHGSSWSEPMPCTGGGIIGLAGPGAAAGTTSFKGDNNYAAVTSGNVWMRKVTGGCYSWRTFRTAVLHEVGHTLGLGHSDQGSSAHSTTSASERANGVMSSVIPASTPSEPQSDDIQAILWLYGADTPAPAPRPRPSVAPVSPRFPVRLPPR